MNRPINQNKSEIESNFEYLRSFSIKSDFVDSLEKQYNERHNLTNKQQDALDDIVRNHKELSIKLDKAPQDKFHDSLRSQFSKSGSLSQKQISFIKELPKDQKNGHR